MAFSVLLCPQKPVAVQYQAAVPHSTGHLQDPEDLSTEEIRSRLKLLIRDPDSLSPPEIFEALKGAGRTERASFAEELFELSELLPLAYSLQCFLSAVAADPDYSLERLLAVVAAADPSDRSPRAIYAAKVIGLYPRLGGYDRLATIVDGLYGNVFLRQTDANWRRRLPQLRSQVGHAKKVLELSNRYSRIRDLDARLRFLTQRPLSCDVVHYIVNGHDLECPWAVMQLEAISKEQPVDVAEWIARFEPEAGQSAIWRESEKPSPSPEAILDYKRTLSEKVSPDCKEMLSQLLEQRPGSDK